MSSYFLSAKEAKELSLSINDKLDELILLPILEKIRSEAQEGKTKLSVNMLCSTMDKSSYISRRLKELGYYVEGFNHRNETSYTISWNHIGDD